MISSNEEFTKASGAKKRKSGPKSRKRGLHELKTPAGKSFRRRGRTRRSMLLASFIHEEENRSI